MGKSYCVYILSNRSNTVLYTGITNNLKRRVFEHKQKIVEGFTKKYNVDKLVYFEVYNDPQSAIEREKQIKNLLRKKKELLINKENSEWYDLYDKL
ncbi:excinuclease ABC subunit C [Candidatus Roizmanbacteria bacterium CG17_big_fil_post_rev_8_21_14_2_50_39_7]|uniref:Excinuclease ABC subunit C n=2 Tax=Candidatus Roizmaniibacteriota TaxID=1752723 RepID=A0A2M7EKD5_9BACT|nr:MAG: excinuclease ABC subunit C [Candidatus Roizmanbacteria bacterium CG03_land_8_20_14_0_80_39_12]PIV70995.1 MAG: excinuclease ABC subunit C [Candidatus Roizmanbacteria bacterium CG17_big_fil_post_rev_8_21_14_2_50_39_7]